MFAKKVIVSIIYSVYWPPVLLTKAIYLDRNCVRALSQHLSRYIKSIACLYKTRDDENESSNILLEWY